MDKLVLTKPARKWVDGIPLGNGITGAMVYGGRHKETIALNDVKFWSGYPKDFDSEESLKNLNIVRQAIFDRKYAEAESLTEEKLDGDYSESYLPLGELVLRFGGLSGAMYRRELDLATAVHTISTRGVIREAFCSYPDKVFCYSVHSEKKFNATLSAKSKIIGQKYIKNGRLIFTGNAPGKDLPPYVASANPIEYDGKGMSFAFAVDIVTDGAAAEFGDKIKVFGARNLKLFVTTATGFKGYDKMPVTDRGYTVNKCLSALDSLTTYDEIKRKHIADYSALYGRESLSLGEDSDIPANELVKLAKKGDVRNALAELLYNFGKYLLISSSRIGGEPATLQGIWNNVVRPPWSSNYTTNINTEMNYWGASEIGVAECLPPYVDFVYDLAVKGKKTAAVNYGARGFCANHNADIWRHTAPVKRTPSYMYAPLCGIWLACEVYEHYRYGALADKKEKVEYIVNEGARFVLDYLVEHDGELVTCPSTSPENRFYVGGKLCSVDYASAFDLGLARQALSNAVAVGTDEKLVAEARAALTKLRPFTIGQDGINEWHEHFPTEDKGHRHFSPLYALYPGRAVDYYKDVELVAAMEKLYGIRLDNAKRYHGWSGAWAICLAGRFRNSARAERVVEDMLAHSIFPNLLDMHPPLIFQIDGNLGFVAGVNELLACVENDTLEVLPALPSKWSHGKITGLRLVGGGVLTLEWEGGSATRVTVEGGNLKLRNKNLDTNVKVSGISIAEA